MNIQRDFFKKNSHKDASYSAQYLVDVGGKEVVFENCDFSYSVIENGYFHKAIFKKCKFIGASFLSCNFRSAIFEQCDFEYATFFQTIISDVEVASNFPARPNQRQDIIRALRVNAISVGDFEANNKLLSDEMKASVDHYYNVATNKHFYYNKYSKITKTLSFLKYLGLRLEGWLWGYGVSPLRLIFWAFVMTCGLAIAVVFLETQWSDELGAIALNISNSIHQMTYGLLDLSLVDPTYLSGHRGAFAIVVSIRTVLLGLFVTVLYRRYAR